MGCYIVIDMERTSRRRYCLNAAESGLARSVLSAGISAAESVTVSWLLVILTGVLQILLTTSS